jgi:hypothetical protein
MQQQERQVIAAEVLEMGELLFTLALEGQSNAAGEEAQHTFPQAEIEAASAEFFAALRLLFDITEE